MQGASDHYAQFGTVLRWRLATGDWRLATRHSRLAHAHPRFIRNLGYGSSQQVRVARLDGAGTRLVAPAPGDGGRAHLRRAASLAQPARVAGARPAGGIARGGGDRLERPIALVYHAVWRAEEAARADGVGDRRLARGRPGRLRRGPG